MITMILKSLFSKKQSKLDKLLTGHRFLKRIIDSNIEYIYIDKLVGTNHIMELLNVLNIEKIQIAFYDNVHPTISDPGAYFSYSSLKSKDDFHWSMTYGNHGWSGGIYQIRDFVLASQIISLIKKEELTRVQISDVVFFSHYDVKAIAESKKKESEIKDMHRYMTTQEIINKISSNDSQQIWEASCEIIALGQDREAIKPLLELIDKLDDLTKGVELGGAFAPNSRFLEGAIKTLKFHSATDSCTCALFGIHDCMDPNKEVEKGVLKIENTVRIENNWVDYYEAKCTRCNTMFEIEEREGHYKFWTWKTIN